MNRTEALAFARSSADTAIDQASEYEDSVASYRDNVRDTLKDERAVELEEEAFEVYDARIAELQA
jgi:hypothetical protein